MAIVSLGYAALQHKGFPMDRREAYGLHLRLQQELIQAYTEKTCAAGHIERLMDELASIRRFVENAPSLLDEQTNDPLVPGMLAE